ncbi:MAG: hypothetical protein IT367_20410 [Candidatus Hydrogenedentes bacterium]|nr:hypothetical protein [Candidatus Hydrogenedentota bacterium]
MRNAQRTPRTMPAKHNIIVAGQSLGDRMTHLQAAMQFYLPGYTVFNAAVGGAGYTGLKLGTPAFTKSVQYGGDQVIIVHGETDAYLYANPATYAAYLQEWRDDYADYLHAPNLKVLFCQCSSQMVNATGTPQIAEVALGQYNTALAGGGTNLYMMGPKYQFPYLADATHLTANGCSWLGQKYAQVLSRLITNGSWLPLYPTSITRSGAAVTIHLNVPVGPLVFDTTTIAAHPNGDYGLVYNDAGGTIAISGTPAISGNTITFNLTGTPSTTPRKIRYGYWPASGTTPILNAGSAYSYSAGGMVYGNIRDSDTVSRYIDNNAYNMGNWLVHFEMDVP